MNFIIDMWRSWIGHLKKRNIWKMPKVDKNSATKNHLQYFKLAF